MEDGSECALLLCKMTSITTVRLALKLTQYKIMQCNVPYASMYTSTAL